MTIDAQTAANAYAQVAKTAANAPQSDISKGVEGPNFADMLKGAVSETSNALKAGEAAAAQVANGDGSLVDVVTAVSAAEVSLEAAIAVRNRVIEAYQEIMRMPI